MRTCCRAIDEQTGYAAQTVALTERVKISKSIRVIGYHNNLSAAVDILLKRGYLILREVVLRNVYQNAGCVARNLSVAGYQRELLCAEVVVRKNGGKVGGETALTVSVKQINDGKIVTRYIFDGACHLRLARKLIGRVVGHCLIVGGLGGHDYIGVVDNLRTQRRAYYNAVL